MSWIVTVHFKICIIMYVRYHRMPFHVCFPFNYFVNYFIKKCNFLKEGVDWSVTRGRTIFLYMFLIYFCQYSSSKIWRLYKSHLLFQKPKGTSSNEKKYLFHIQWKQWSNQWNTSQQVTACRSPNLQQVQRIIIIVCRCFSAFESWSGRRKHTQICCSECECCHHGDGTVTLLSPGKKERKILLLYYVHIVFHLPKCHLLD